MQMSFRLSNQNHPDQALSVTNGAWFDIISLAEDYGWNPLGPVNEDWTLGIVDGFSEISLNEPGFWAGSYTGEDGSLVLLDDALNLADALERAFIESDPQPSLDYLPGYAGGMGQTNGSLRAGIGVILAVKDFCYRGAFWFERL
jgi:hypothetical protein